MPFGARTKGLTERVRSTIAQREAQMELPEAESIGTLTVRVELSHIARAGKIKDKSSTGNPIALAIVAALPTKKVYIAVWPGRVKIGSRCFELPLKAQIADKQWCEKLEMSPFTFVLDRNKQVQC